MTSSSGEWDSSWGTLNTGGNFGKARITDYIISVYVTKIYCPQKLEGLFYGKTYLLGPICQGRLGRIHLFITSVGLYFLIQTVQDMGSIPTFYVIDS